MALNVLCLRQVPIGQYWSLQREADAHVVRGAQIVRSSSNLTAFLCQFHVQYDL
jgi:hypothetical protein